MKYLKEFRVFESLVSVSLPEGDYVILNQEESENGSNKNKQGRPEPKDKSDLEKKDREEGEINIDRINPEEFEKAEATMKDQGKSIKKNLGTLAGKTGKVYQAQRALGAGGTLKEVTDIWQNAKKKMIDSGFKGLGDKAKSLIQRILNTPPRVDWKKELAKLYDKETRKFVEKIPNRRMLGLPGNPIMYGRKRAGSEGFKTAVYVVDTSGSISQKQSNVFLEEMMRLNKKFEIDETLIIYCSDNIDNWEIVKKGKQPNLSLWKSTGGNANGFGPPFKLIEELKKKPSFICYFTDTMADFPSVNQYGIDKYVKKVYWFICKLDKNFRIPPFGNYLWIPMDDKGNTI